MILSVKRRNITAEEKRFSALHISRPLTLKDIMFLAKVKKHFTMSPSTFKRLSKNTKSFISTNKIKIDFVKKAGRPIDINPERILKIIELHNAGFTVRKIAEKTNFPKSTIHYLIKTAKRNRIKYKGMTVFVD